MRIQTALIHESFFADDAIKAVVAIMQLAMSGEGKFVPKPFAAVTACVEFGIRVFGRIPCLLWNSFSS